MKYFIPEWDDRVDPKYDFTSDRHSTEHNENPTNNDYYMWDIFGTENVPFDGVLVSRMTIKDKKSKYQRILDEGIHNALRLPNAFEIMGDCGAWGYIKEEKPIFKTSETLDYYVRCGFNYGVSIDHLIVPGLDSKTNKNRWKLTIENARDMYELWYSKEKYYNSIRIIGVAQGWDPQSYREAVAELLKIGYDYIAIGGIAKSNSGFESVGEPDSKTVYNVVKAVWLEVSNWMKDTGRRIDIHTFGVARPDLMAKLANLGVTSCDSASYLRRSWMRRDMNYMKFPNGSAKESFSTAIRIRFSEDNRAWSRLDENEKSRLKRMENSALESIRAFAEGKSSINETINSTIKYERTYLRLEGDSVREEKIKQNPKKATSIEAVFKRKEHLQSLYLNRLEKVYEQTLQDRPWTKCPCIICKSIGVEVIIFRGNNRNRRRGFHNVFAFHSLFRRKIPRILALTFCSATKDPRRRWLPAFERYLESNNIKTYWNNVVDLPIEVAMFSARYGILDWSNKIPKYDYKIQEEDVPKFVEELKTKLSRYDKIFFIGLNDYRKVIETIKDQTSLSIDIFPKLKYAFYEGQQRRLDILEYQKQMKYFREAIVKEVPSFLPAQDALRSQELQRSKMNLDQYIKTQ